jgi:hypothetical protein
MSASSARSYDTIKYEVDGHKATITLNRPDALNALSPHMVTELRSAYSEAENDDAVWILIVTGTGRAFCTGADVKAIPGDGKVINERPYLSTYEQWEAPQEGTPPFRTMAKPVLAAINGICCGAGLDWVTTGDIVIASDKATFFDPHVSIGLVAAREVVRVARVLPRSRSPTRSTPMRPSPSGALDWPFSRASTYRCTKPRCWPKHFANATCTPRIPSRGPRRSSKSDHRNGSADELPDDPAPGGRRRPGRHYHLEPARPAQRFQPNDV